VAAGAGALTQGLLAFSHKGSVAAQPIDATEALSVLTQLLPRALGSKIKVEVRFDKELPAIVAAPVQLARSC
jgi:hypothetical protein